MDDDDARQMVQQLYDALCAEMDGFPNEEFGLQTTEAIVAAERLPWLNSRGWAASLEVAHG